MDINDSEQKAREQLGRDLLNASKKAAAQGQAATQAMLMDLGAFPSAFDGGEAANALSLLGLVAGSLVDDGASLAQVQKIMLGNRGALSKLDIVESRRVQICAFLDFTESQVQRICRPGTAAAVTAAMVAIFSRTLAALRMSTAESPD